LEYRLGYTAAHNIMRIIVILFIIVILGSLGSALYYMIRDRGTTERTVKALTVRIALSVTLFLLLMLSFHFGFITTRL
jgi:uncharacterized membrane protein